MKQLLTLILTVFAGFLASAQDLGKISGVVADGTQKTIESATISLLRGKDSVAIKYSVADKYGNYKFEDVKPGSYLVSISAVGHKKGFSSVFEVSSNPVVLETITLLPVDKTM